MIPNAGTTCAYLKTHVRPFRPVAVRLLRLVGDPTANFRQVADLIQTDPVLSMELLKIANSPLLPARMEIKSVLQAIVFLGSNMVSGLVLTTCLRALVPVRSSRCMQACWRHNLAAALICQRMSGTLNIPEANAYTAGLIHDLGQIAFLTAYPAYEKALVPGEDGLVEPIKIERSLFGLDHMEAGRWLLGQWGCPLELQNVAAKHDGPPGSPSRQGNLIRLVHAASKMADLMGLSVVEAVACEDLEQIAAGLPEAAPQLTAEAFAATTEWVMTKVNGVEVSLGFTPELQAT
jgi:HD-like signal output (HDOD) protein